MCTIIVFALCKELFAGSSFKIWGLVFFSMQSNILVLLCLMAFVVVPLSRKAIDMLRGTSLLAILLTGIVYNFGIFDVFSDWGTEAFTFSRVAAHIVVPAMYVLDWLLFDVHGGMKWKDILIWAIYPLCYCIASVVAVEIIGLSIYYFFDASKGIGHLVLSSFLLVCVGIVICLFIIGLDKLMSRGVSGCKRSNSGRGQCQ